MAAILCHRDSSCIRGRCIYRDGAEVESYKDTRLGKPITDDETWVEFWLENGRPQRIEEGKGAEADEFWGSGERLNLDLNRRSEFRCKRFMLGSSAWCSARDADMGTNQLTFFAPRNLQLNATASLRFALPTVNSLTTTTATC